MSSAVIVDPGIVRTLAEDSLSEIAIPMLLINLREEGTIPAGVYAGSAAFPVPQ